jgi:signal transduction histidine kinase
LEKIDFRELFEKSPGLYLVLKPDLSIVAVTDAYLRATMTVREEITGRGIFDVFPDNPEDTEADGVSNLRASLMRVLQNKTTDTMAIQKYDIKKPASEGGEFEERYWSPFNSPVLNEKGDVRYIIHRVEDVTEFIQLKNLDEERSRVSERLRLLNDRMELELLQRGKDLSNANRALESVVEELRKRTNELKRSNDELNRFAATAAHDIKAPFRSVGGFLEIVRGKVKDIKDPELTMAFDRITAARNRIAVLIDDLLTFARISDTAENIELVDLEAVIHDVLKNLEYNIKETGAKVVVVGKMPKLNGYAFQLSQLFQNLIGNALKFQNKDHPVIRISVTDAGPDYKFSVEDNGIGIESKYFDKIFGVFERLHGQSEFSGSGLGLAICQRVVEHHNGRIWVESELGKGTTFHFTIPKN